jgi:ribonuclease R
MPRSGARATSRGPLFLDLPERKIILNAEGQVDRVLVPERLDAHRLIEEFMILANVAAAEALEKANSPLVYRVHDEPSLEKMRALGEVLASVGHKLPKAGALKPALFNGILRQFAGSEHEPFINEVVLRSQAQAVYAAENLGHFGLNLRRYAHFTSPIRRYADLIVHRALIRSFGFGDDGLPAGTTTEQLSKIGEEISAAERRAMAAERDTIDRLIAFHLADQIGATFTGRISGVTKSGLFVKLAGTGADGFIPAATIGADYYRYEERQHALVGDRTGETYRLGDTVEVKLVEAAPIAGALRFELLSEARRAGRTASRPSDGPSAAPRPRSGSSTCGRPSASEAEGEREPHLWRRACSAGGYQPVWRGFTCVARAAARAALPQVPEGRPRVLVLRPGIPPSQGGRLSALHRHVRGRSRSRIRHLRVGDEVRRAAALAPRRPVAHARDPYVRRPSAAREGRCRGPAIRVRDARLRTGRRSCGSQPGGRRE